MNKIIAFARVFILLFISGACNEQAKPSPGNADSGIVEKSPAATPSIKTILFFGNSLTAGYGLDDPSLAFASLIQQKIDSLHLPYKAVNAGVSGETSAGGNSRIEWVLRQPVDVFVLELGANDGLRGIPVSETRKNLQSIIDKVKEKYPAVKLVLAGMQVPPNMGQKYAADFRALYPELAKKNEMILIPFLLKGVGGEASLNQQDGIHPNVEGHKIIAGNVWHELKDVLE